MCELLPGSNGCKCNLCQRNQAFRTQVSQLNTEQRAYFEALYDTFMHVEMDRDYYRAVLDGSWPNADQVLSQFRARGEARRAQAQELPQEQPQSAAQG